MDDCPICRDTLDCPHFQSPSEDREDTVVSNSIVRLKCGHAYHSGCLCKTFREQGTDCPTCRSSLQESPHSNDDDAEEEWIFVNNGYETSITYEVVLDADVQKALSESVQSSDEIQKKRARVNKAMREYRALEKELQRKRYKYTQEALRDLREDYLTEYRCMKRKLKKELLGLRSIQVEHVLSKLPNVSTTSLTILKDMCSLGACVGNRDAFGPLKKVFWY